MNIRGGGERCRMLDMYVVYSLINVERRVWGWSIVWFFLYSESGQAGMSYIRISRRSFLKT